MDAVDVALEVGGKKVFATALDWPGWSRSGRDEEAALASLLAYAPRYAAVVGDSFVVPDGRALAVAERLPASSGTDFGVPGAQAERERAPVDEAELTRLTALLRWCWAGFDAAADRATGIELRRGPRGGGRDLDGIRAHVYGADAGYVRAVGGTASPADPPDVVREAFVAAVVARNRGELPERGPRGGRRWPARFAVRYTAWHSLDHAWEIEDRS